MQILDISELAQRAGVPASTLRYYEEQGLISSIGRRGLRRVFAGETLQQLGLIALARSAGFSLSEIGGMFGPDGQPALSREQWRAKADEMEEHIARLGDLRDLIRHVAECPAPRHVDCAQFRQLMASASATRREETRKPRATTLSRSQKD